MKGQVLISIGVITAAFIAGSAATAASGWRVFATSSDSGDYATFASADATVQHPRAIGVRVSGRSDKQVEVNWSLLCDGVLRPRPGAVSSLSVPAAAKCMLQASAVGGAGSLKVELLRR